MAYFAVLVSEKATKYTDVCAYCLAQGTIIQGHRLQDLDFSCLMSMLARGLYECILYLDAVMQEAYALY